MKNIYLRVVSTNCGETIFKFLDVPILISHFTPAGVFLPSENQKICYIIVIRSKLQKKF